MDAAPMLPFAPPATWFAASSPAIQTWHSLNRCGLAGGRMLTVPVEGGATALKRIFYLSGKGEPALKTPRLSEHGRWRDEHLGAINAIYGSSPYFRHLFPEIESIYRHSEGMSLQAFNSELIGMAQRWLEPDTLLPEIKLLSEGNPERFRRIGEDTLRKVDINLSIFDALFRLGKETIFSIHYLAQGY